MATQAKQFELDSFCPLIGGIQTDLADLFDDWQYVKVSNGEARRYEVPLGYYLFGGLPGSLKDNEVLCVKPKLEVRRLAESVLANGVIGEFRSVRSARLMKHKALPVYVADPLRVSSPLLALLPYAEHDNFEGRAQHGHK